MPDEPIVITTRFERVQMGVEKKLSIALELARDEANHSGIKGDKVEIATRKVLRDHLPPNLSVGEGIVYDSFGDETGQTDVIIANGEQPFTFPWGESGEYAIEGVSAVGEVKSNLTPGELKDCIDKATRYKRLRQVIGASDQVTNLSEYIRETSLIPPFFVIAHESRMKMSTILTKLEDAALVPVPEGKGFLDDSPQPPIDAICILGKGAAFNQRSGKGAAFQISIDGQPRPGWLSMEGGDAPLATTLGWLHFAMPRILRAHSVVGQYFIPRARQAQYMINVRRAALGLEPLAEVPSMQVTVTAYPRPAKKGAAKTVKKAAAKTVKKAAAKKGGTNTG